MKLEKYGKRDNKKIGILIFTICCILLIAGVFLYTSYAWYEENQDFNLINGTVEDPGDLYFAIYVDDVLTTSMPTKDSGYTLDTEKSSCTNGVTITWNLSKWSATTDFTNYSQENSSRTKCTLYFKEASAYDDCVSEYGAGDPRCSILANLDTTGACPTVNDDGTVNVTGVESTNGYVCSATDDYGTSYYYRGNVTNNYVKFAGFYWRVIRINGDGSIRMIYAGVASVIDALDDSTKETVMTNGYDDSSTLYTQIGTSKYNSSYNDNAYVGYMYGTAGSSTYEETHANINSSTIKTTIDSWYETNLKGTEYEAYLSDALFCNDRSFASNNTGTGVGTSVTYYRWYYGAGDTNKNYPRLTCTQQNDRFTVNDTTLGNGALTYPTGLITMDEVHLAGFYYGPNTGYYLYTGYAYWAMSPYEYGPESNRARVKGVSSAGAELGSQVVVTHYVRPVINLSLGSLKSGTGTWDNPYVVQ